MKKKQTTTIESGRGRGRGRGRARKVIAYERFFTIVIWLEEIWYLFEKVVAYERRSHMEVQRKIGIKNTLSAIATEMPLSYCWKMADSFPEYDSNNIHCTRQMQKIPARKNRLRSFARSGGAKSREYNAIII